MLQKTFSFPRPFLTFTTALWASLLPLATTAHADVDTNNNDLDDIWELYYGASSLSANGDEDNDSMTNAEESRAGTNPFDPTSVLSVHSILPGQRSIQLQWNAIAHKSYQVFESSTLNSFSPATTAKNGPTGIMSEIISTGSANRQFYQVSVRDIDSDSDNITNWAEILLGLNPNDSSSTPGTNDFAVVTNAMGQPTEVSLQVINSVAQEGGQGARIQINRSGKPAPLTIPLSITHGTTNPSDFSMAPTSVTLSMSESSIVVTIAASTDALTEGEETFSIALQAGSGYTLGNSSAPLSIVDAIGPTLSSAQKASRFLHQATFGPKESEIIALASQMDSQGETAALEAWIDAQDALPATDMGSINPSRTYNYPMLRDWMELALDAPDQLRQRVAYALSQILVVSIRNPELRNARGGVSIYYDMLIDESFGHYGDLLLRVSLSPIMGMYLSHLGNEKADPANGKFPDENYAREIMQLFSIGLTELNQDGTSKLDINGEPIPTYDNSSITELARVFTGLSFRTRFNSTNPNDRNVPMIMYEDRHDTEAKQLITYPGIPNGGLLPAHTEDPGRTGMDDVEEAVEVLFNHPNTGPFIARRLIQRLVKSHPSPQYISDVAAAFSDNGSGIRGDMKAVVKAILLHNEARNPAMIVQNTHGRLREPLLQEINLFRAFSLPQNNGQYTFEGHIFFNRNSYVGYQNIYRMRPLSSPSVFNFFTPEYQPVGELKNRGLSGPEFQIIDDSSLVIGQAHLYQTTGRGPRQTDAPFQFTPLDVSRETSILTNQGASALIEHLDMLFAPGQVSNETRSIILTALNETIGQDAEERARMALYLLVASPDYAIAR